MLVFAQAPLIRVYSIKTCVPDSYLATESAHYNETSPHFNTPATRTCSCITFFCVASSHYQQKRIHPIFFFFFCSREMWMLHQYGHWEQSLPACPFTRQRFLSFSIVPPTTNEHFLFKGTFAKVFPNLPDERQNSAISRNTLCYPSYLSSNTQVSL